MTIWPTSSTSSKTNRASHGRTGWGDVPLRLRDEIIPGAARFKTAGAGMAWPAAGAQGDPSRADVMYFVTTPEEARAAVQDYVRMKPEFIKIWIDDLLVLEKNLAATQTKSVLFFKKSKAAGPSGEVPNNSAANKGNSF
jgi:hypothetical protein